MTKDKLMSMFDSNSGMGKLLNEFFNLNVVIPRGTNRHPYADVLHEWIEGAEIQQSCEDKYIGKISALQVLNAERYRIKPSEPVYEWQWLVKYDMNEDYKITPFLTEDEIENISDYDRLFILKVEETKRERK